MHTARAQGVEAAQPSAHTDAQQQLTPVQVIGAAVVSTPLSKPYAGGQVARGGRLGMLGNVDVMNSPFNITHYTTQLIENQQAATVLDVLKNDPSVRERSAPGGGWSYFDIRGFTVDTSEVSFDGLYGMAPRYGGLSAVFTERVEVLKGSSALLYGMSPNGVVGGAVNLMPKRADDKPLTRLTLGIESDALWRSHMDMGRRFGADDQCFVPILSLLKVQPPMGTHLSAHSSLSLSSSTCSSVRPIMSGGNIAPCLASSSISIFHERDTCERANKRESERP